MGEKLAHYPSVYTQPKVWVKDDYDEKLMKQFVTGPVMRHGHVYSRIERNLEDNVRDMAMQGIFPKGMDAKSFATTARDYCYALVQLLGLMQEEMLHSNPEQLVDGRIHIWQFISFKQPKFLLTPMTITRLLDKMKSPNMKIFAHCAYKQLVESIALYLDTPEGRSIFYKNRLPKEQDLGELEMDDLARNQLMREISHLNNVGNMLVKDKPFTKMGGARDADRQEKEQYKTEYEGYRIPDAIEAVQKVLSHKKTRDLLKNMVDYAEDKTVVSKKEMTRISCDFALTLHLQFGHRIQWVDNLTRGDFKQARINGEAAYPYQQVEGSALDTFSQEIKKNIWSPVDDPDARFSVRDPYKKNPNMIGDNATQEENDCYNLTKGIVARINNHKMGAKYPLYLFFSRYVNV